MAEVAIAVLVVLAVWLVLGLVAALGFRAVLARANRVAVGVRSPAPVRWRWTPSRSAHLHRRLQTLAWPIDPGRPELGPPTAPLTDDLRRQIVEAAVDLDGDLARFRRAPARVRRDNLREVATHVATLEHASACLQGLPATPAPADPVLGELAERAAQLRAGRAEVEVWTSDPPVPPGTGAAAGAA